MDPSNGLASLGWKKYKGPGSETLVDLLKNTTDVQHPIQLEDPTSFDSGCAALGLGL